MFEGSNSLRKLKYEWVKNSVSVYSYSSFKSNCRWKYETYYDMM